jgi:ribosomal protein S18 acetylase RimI-like enzyme
MDEAIRELKVDPAAQMADLRKRWAAPEVRIVVHDGSDIGWLQSRLEDDALFLAQLFVDATSQGRGYGTEALNLLIEEADATNRAVTLGVVKSNPAQRLYERLGFRTTHSDQRKFYMRREPPTEAPISR